MNSKREISIGHVITKDGSKGADVVIDLDELTESRMLVQGGSGAGKTHTLVRIIEQSYRMVQVIILDREGDFVALRKHFDFVIAGKGRDIPADPGTAELLAQKALEHRFPLIVDLFEHKQSDRETFVKRFLEALTEAPPHLWHPVLVVIDEADEFAPERSEGVALSTKEVADIAKRGRKRGYAILIGTQRISAVNKTVLSQCRNKVVGFADLDLDIKRSSKSIGLRGEDGESVIQDLQRGEFIMKGPAIGRSAVKVKVGPIKTELKRTVVKGAAGVAPPPSEKLRRLLAAELSDLASQAKEDLREKQALKDALRSRDARIQVLEKQSAKAGARELEALAKEHSDRLSAVLNENRVLEQHHSRLLAKIAELGALAGTKPKTSPKPFASPKLSVVRGTAEFHSAGPEGIALISAASHHVVDEVGETGLSPYERLILKFLAEREPHAFSKTQIAAWIKRSKKSSSFDLALTRLRNQGLVRSESGRFALAEGAGPRARIILGADFGKGAGSLEDWKDKLKPAPRKLLEILLGSPDSSFSRAELAELSQYSATSSSFDGAIAELCSIGLAARGDGGTIRLNPDVHRIA